MLSRLVLRAAPAALRSLPPPAALGVLHTTRPLHTTRQCLAPLPPLPEKGGEVRYGLIPEEFFQFLYPKTGVTGPYMLGTGLLLYFLSKEIYVINHETVAAACILSIIVYGIKKYGSDVAAFADKLNEEKVAKALAVKNEAIKDLETAIEQEKKEQWRIEGRNYLFDAKRNNIAMLLETNYRERLLMVYNEVKKRLDYQVAMQNLKRQKEQDHMIQWVEKNVVQSITPQQQKESIAKCILDLKALSKSAQAAVLTEILLTKHAVELLCNASEFLPAGRILGSSSMVPVTPAPISTTVTVRTTVHTTVLNTVADLEASEVKCWTDNHEILYTSLAFLSGILSTVVVFAIFYLIRRRCKRSHQHTEEPAPSPTATEESAKNIQNEVAYTTLVFQQSRTPTAV